MASLPDFTHATSPLSDSIGQLVGDYRINLEVDRHAPGEIVKVQTILVVDYDDNSEFDAWADFIRKYDIKIYVRPRDSHEIK